MSRGKKRPNLRALAERLGILPSYIDTSAVRRDTSEATYEALLAAMGVDASDEQLADGELIRLREQAESDLLPAVEIVRTPGATASTAVRTAHIPPGEWDWFLEVTEEHGTAHTAEGRLTARKHQRTALRAAARLPHGYHRVRLTLRNSQRELTAEQLQIVAPPSCLPVTAMLGDRRLFGLNTNLYTVRTRRNWGAGDLGDLTELLGWCADIGAAFLGVNPLHALRNRGGDISPYAPVSRLYRNPLYLDVTTIPEFAISKEAQALVTTAEHRAAVERLRALDRVDYESVMAEKVPVLGALHRTFAERHRDRRTTRGRAYATFCRTQGSALDDFATFLTLEDHLASDAAQPRDWRRWPAPYRNPRSPEVARFRERFSERIDFHRWIQFALDTQLAAAADHARTRGLAVGMYGDLAIGSSPSGSDTWALPHLFLGDAHVGSPPDDYSPTGQDWGLPPIHPGRLLGDRYHYWICLVRNAMQHFGAVRIDHVMGLFRQFLIPAGRPGEEGAYVRFPANHLLAILALESHRNRTLVIGEDLGTVPKGLPLILARWNILSTRVFYFERDHHGRFRPARRYSPRALVSATTHDNPPLAGFWEGKDLVLRRATDAIPTDGALASARIQRDRDKRALLSRLHRSGILDHEPRRPAELVAAVHRFLAETPAPLMGVSLDDLAGETDPVNLPGVGLDRYPSWSRRMRLPIEALRDDAGVSEALEGLTSRVPRRSPGQQ